MAPRQTIIRRVLLSRTIPHGLSFNTSTGTFLAHRLALARSPSHSPRSNASGTGTGTLTLTVNGVASPDSTPWPVNLARKGTIAFADVTALPSTPTAITPTTSVGSMGGFPSTTRINKLMGWRNYATTQQSGCLLRYPFVSVGLSTNNLRQLFPRVAALAFTPHLSPPCQQRRKPGGRTKR